LNMIREESDAYQQTVTDLSSNETVHIKIKVGDTSFEFECNAKDVAKITKGIFDSLQKLGATPLTFSAKKYRCLEECIQDLINKGWFTLPRTLSEVCEKLRELGYSYNRGYVSHLLKHFNDKGILLRIGTERRYLYKETEREEASG